MENPKVDSIQEKEWFESLNFFYIFQEKEGSFLFLFLIFFNH